MSGKRASINCEDCSQHPTRRVYMKVNNIFRGFAWVCPKCRHFTIDKHNLI